MTERYEEMGGQPDAPVPSGDEPRLKPSHARHLADAKARLAAIRAARENAEPKEGK